MLLNHQKISIGFGLLFNSFEKDPTNMELLLLLPYLLQTSLDIDVVGCKVKIINRFSWPRVPSLSHM